MLEKMIVEKQKPVVEKKYVVNTELVFTEEMLKDIRVMNFTYKQLFDLLVEKDLSSQV